jgi:hypothetical protein
MFCFRAAFTIVSLARTKPENIAQLAGVRQMG